VTNIPDEAAADVRDWFARSEKAGRLLR